MMKSLVLLAALAAPSLSRAQDNARPISLEEAIELAKRNSPSMISARGQLRTSAAAVRQAKWAFSPFNNLQFSYGSSTGGGGSYDSEGFLRVRPASDWAFSQGFGNASLTIWDGGTKIGNLRRAHANVEAAEAAEVSSEFNITQQVKAQFHSILQARESEANAQAQLEQAQLQMRIAQARLRAGTTIRSDSLQAFIAIINAQLAIANARNQQNTANATLTRLTGSEFSVTAAVSDTADPAPLRINDADLFALAEEGPAVRQSAAQYRVAQINERNSRAIYWPQISASAGYSRSNSDKRYDFGAGPMNYSWNFSLSASLRIFDGFARESNILSSRVAADNAEAQLREQKFQIRQNLTQQLGALRTAEETIRLQRLNIAAAELALQMATTRYELGAGVLLDVITAQNQLNTARSSLTNARVQARNARAQIESIIGRELPE